MILHTEYQGSRPSDFRQEDFFMVSYLAYVNYLAPGVGPFLIPGALFEQTW